MRAVTPHPPDHELALARVLRVVDLISARPDIRAPALVGAAGARLRRGRAGLAGRGHGRIGDPPPGASPGRRRQGGGGLSSGRVSWASLSGRLPAPHGERRFTGGTTRPVCEAPDGRQYVED